ncbi:EthD domain-containing protein [Myxozyma melibiosi]|uniref:EthD domain-containing protein n=1 Tax=Myxozyma melibiosi TaxID=54550 RepID=A0ABR1FCU2_9ASCO
MSLKEMTRVSVMARRNPAMSLEEFQKYLKESHGPLVAPWLKRYGVVKYVQHHKREAFSRDGSPIKALELGDFDSLADFYVPSYADFEKAFKDPEYFEKIKPDEEKILDMESVVIVVGVNHEVI